MDAHEKITIYGDYDVDGITATSILYLYLSKAGAEVDYYLPDRMTEGYGLNENAVRMLAETGTKLMVTVDTGISAVKECQLAKSLAMDVVITDHHECQEKLPGGCGCCGMQKQPGEKSYPLPLSGGMRVWAYKLVQGAEKLTEMIRRILQNTWSLRLSAQWQISYHCMMKTGSLSVKDLSG